MLNQDQIFTKAHELMTELDIHELPVDPFDVATRLGIPVVSYEEAREGGFALAADDILRGKVRADAFCYRKRDRYIIFYDESCPTPKRINFTIAHELGHIRLNHFQQNGYYTRYIQNKKCDPNEREADSFAGELLRPPVLLILAGINKAKDISLCCDITTTAARAAMNAINQIKNFIDFGQTAITAAFFKKQFDEFLHTYYCHNCHTTFRYLDYYAHCPKCGSMGVERKFLYEQKANLLDGSDN